MTCEIKNTKEVLEHYSKLPDAHQSWWQLAAIQLTGMTSLPILIGSVLIIQNSNIMSAIITLIIGNALLWLIRFGIISMSSEGRKSALDITYDYFGKVGAYFIAILLLASTLAWFVMQTTLASNALSYLVPIEKGLNINLFMQIGVLIGILSTLFCMNGIVVIRWVSIISLPILIIAFIGIMFGSHPTIPAKITNGISISGLPIILGTSLGITVDIPTFFRHSKSKKDSINALTLIQILGFAIGLGGIFLGSVIEPWIGIKTDNVLIAHDHLLKYSLIAFIFISAICANISNVYSSSVGWELIAPIFAGVKEYLILGLGLSISFIMIANIFSMEMLASITDSSLTNLCLVFVIAYLIKLFNKRMPNFLEKGTYFLAWLFSSSINILQIFKIIKVSFSTLCVGFCVIVLTLFFFLLLAHITKQQGKI